VIRFACPSCKSVLASQEEHAGQIVVCPKCGQRMQTPPPPPAAREETTRPRQRRLIAGIAWVGVILLAGTAGVLWFQSRFHNSESEPIVAARETPPPSSEDRSRAATVRERPNKQLPDGRGSDRDGTATVKERPAPPLADSRGSDGPLRQSTKPPIEEPPPLPPPAEKKKELDLADDLPPEWPFDLVDAINVQRARAGVEPIFIDAEASRACQSRAELFARHAGRLPRENQEKESVAAESPLAAVEKWLKEPARRAAILDPHLRTFGAGFARNVEGQWFSAFDWNSGRDRQPPMAATPVTGAIVYPAPGQMRLSLWFPGNEVPDPLPQTKEKVAGYPITLTFPPQTPIEKVDAHLSNKEEGDIAVWLSSPEKPANPQFPGSQRNTICLIAKKPLRPNTRYRVAVSATVNGATWSANWDFATISEGQLHHELAGTCQRMLNRLRRRAGLPPVPLDAERSRACAAHARYLGRNAPDNPTLNWNEEKPDLPGYTAEGAALARTASIQGGGGPMEAVAGLIDSLISRPQLLDPRLHRVGLGYTPFGFGGWIWVIDLHHSVGRIGNPSYRAPGGETDREYFYPAPDQDNVPLIYPPNELPTPIPASNRDKLAGYAIMVLFGPRVQVTAGTAILVDDKGTEVEGWFSTPEKPAIAGFSQHSLCFLPKMPLQPDTRYTATFQAEINGKPWRRRWSFTTLKEPDRYSDDLDKQITARVNAVRKAAGLSPVRLDAELSRGCQSHAHYLTLNHRRPEILGMGMHRQDSDLPGASPEGARAAKASVIAIVLDPQTCVENWMATLYHRIPILTPNLERIGFGHARIQGHKWVCVLDTGNGRTPQSRDR
jgi:uncharacterized protein YkwD